MDFETALREQLNARPKSRFRGRWAQRLLKLVNGPPSAKRTRILARLESHARAHLVSEGMASATGAIDWSSIDWNKVFDTILKILMALLPFLLALSLLVMLLPVLVVLHC